MNWDVIGILGNIINSAKNLSRSEKQSIYDTVSHALSRTRTIIAQTRRDGEDQPSNILSMTWQEASNQLKKIKNESILEFAETLEYKSKYWSNPANYTADQLTEYKMRLVQVEKELKQLTQ